MGKLHRTYNETLSFLPSRELLVQILKAEGINDFGENPEDYYKFTKEYMLSRILDTEMYLEVGKKKKIIHGRDNSEPI